MEEELAKDIVSTHAKDVFKRRPNGMIMCIVTGGARCDGASDCRKCNFVIADAMYRALTKEIPTEEQKEE